MTRQRLFQLAFWAALIGACVMATLPKPPHTPLDHYGDKVQHMAAFAVLAALSALGYSRTPLMRLAERLSFLGALIELVQSVPLLHRDCDIRDWIADTLAIGATLLLVAVARRLSGGATWSRGDAPA